MVFGTCLFVLLLTRSKAAALILPFMLVFGYSRLTLRIRVASCVLLAAAGIYFFMSAPVQENMPAAGPDSGVAATDRATQETQPLPLQEPSVESLMVMSRQLENRVRQFRDNVGDMPARELVYEVELQDLIAQVDEGLSRNPGSVELWSQRVNLLMDVASLYENNLRRDYYRIASL